MNLVCPALCPMTDSNHVIIVAIFFNVVLSVCLAINWHYITIHNYSDRAPPSGTTRCPRSWNSSLPGGAWIKQWHQVCLLQERSVYRLWPAIYIQENKPFAIFHQCWGVFWLALCVLSTLVKVSRKKISTTSWVMSIYVCSGSATTFPENEHFRTQFYTI